MQGPYFYLDKVLLSISSRIVHKYIYIYRKCCESVPWDRPGSYISISIKIYVVRRRGRLAPRQPLSVCALLPASREG